MSDTLQQFFKQVGKTDLLTREQEVELSKLIEQGNVDARNHMIQANLRLAISIAKKYQNQGVPLSDLINEGNLGLIRAAHKFDETKGIKFIKDRRRITQIRNML